MNFVSFPKKILFFGVTQVSWCSPFSFFIEMCSSILDVKVDLNLVQMSFAEYPWLAFFILV